ncbi:MAG: shikimate dehydrogenase [Gammaproteobacteria bacterium]|jgi:shikimate dehydrogenase|nr:shikimate dehydrogenase [Gammaproteobacteria bacterium]
MSSPDKYAVIGHPIEHSKSPVIHRLFAEQTGENISYEAIDVPPDELNTAVTRFMTLGGRGLNVTVPHKQNVFNLMDECTERAELAGAVNTVIRLEDGSLRGDNTDGIGLLRDLRDNLGLELEETEILVLGAGGAARGILPPLAELRPDELVVANRTLERAIEIADDLADIGRIKARSYDELEDKAFGLVINATSAGLAGELPPFPQHIIGPHTICYDLSYSMRDTPFVAWAKQRGCSRAYQGWGMLVEQAAESFELWRHVRPDTAPVRARLP